MYWWNYRALAGDLKNGAVSKDSFIGYVLLFALAYIAGFLFDYSERTSAEPVPNNNLMTALYYGSIALTVIVSYVVNRSGDNTDFIKRYICINWPITVRSYIIVVPLAILLGFMMFSSCLGGSEESMSNCIDSKLSSPLIYIIGAAFYVYLLNLYIKAFRIASGKEVSA